MAQGPLYVLSFSLDLFEGLFFVHQCALHGCFLRYYHTAHVGIDDAKGLSILAYRRWYIVVWYNYVEV